MDNPSPIYYRDLITPDNSITTLISQLDALIAKYNSAKSEIQGAATEAAKSMQNLSGATEEQRQNISALATESEKLAKHYERYNKEEREVYRQKQSVVQATKEQQRIDKLLVEINNSVEGSYKRLSAQYRLNKIRLNEMTAEQRRSTEAGRKLETETRLIYEEMSRLQKATGKYTLEVGHYENALRALPGPIGQVVSGFSNMRGQLGAIAGSGLPLGTKALQGFTTILTGTVGMLMLFVRHLTGSAKTLREFEQANADLSTILGVNRKDMQGLVDSALALGRSTEYTASQVTQLQTELAKLGFGQGSIMAMQKSVLQFATAVGANLGEAASVAGATLRAFNLTSADTEDVLATLAVATNNSALSFSRIQDSIGTVFPVANAFGLTVKDTTALLGALANAGFDASSAATATRNIILNLSDASGKLAQRLGGSVRTFDEIFEALIKLRDSGVNLNEELKLTDRRSVAAFSSFLSGAESTRELRASLEDVSGELERIEKERLNTVEGSTKLLKSAWEGLTLAFQESQGTIKDTIDWLTKLIGNVQRLLFPTETITSEWADKYLEEFRKTVKGLSRDVAEERITATTSMVTRQYLAAAEALEESTFLNAGKRRKAFEDAERKYMGAMKARKQILDQMDNEEQEREKQRRSQRTEAEQKQAEADKKALAAAKKAAEKAKKQRIADRRAVVESINLEIAATEAGTDKMLQLRLDKVEAQRQLELEQNRQKTESERQDEAAINAKYDRERIEAEKAFNAEVSKIRVQRLQAEQQAIQLQIAITEEGSEEMLRLRLENIDKQRDIEIEQNRQKDEKVRQDEKAINAKYDAMRLKESADFNNKLAQRDMEAARDLAQAEFDLLDKNERQKTLFRLRQERKRLEDILKLNETATKKMTDDEIKAIKATIEGIDKEASRLGYKNIFEIMGLSVNSDQQDALRTAFDSIKGSLSEIADAWTAAADAAVAAADKQVEAAQKALDAEIEARNQGYANEVETAQKELALAQKNREAALKEQERAQRAQALMDSATQTSSLVTASANIWKAFSGIPVVGPALAAAALVTMWGSFAAAKIKASQVSRSEQYGEGTVELLEGGSHASGHDIDLGTKKDGTRRRAEGGEYFAVINKKNSRRFRDVIPDVINSFNDGTFAERYRKANASLAGAAVGMVVEGTDVSGLERDVAAIRRQGDESRFVDQRGNVVVRYKNLTRKIKS